LPVQMHEVIIPSYAAWFRFNDIHDLERQAVPEFFNGRNKSKTPAIYQDYRNFMINTYRLNPTEYLTVTACRRNLAGDVCAIIRVHAFLEQWGLVNYQVDADARPTMMGPAFTGHFRITADTPRGLVPLFPAVAASQLDAVPAPATVPALAAATAAAAATPAPATAPGKSASSTQLPHKFNCATCGVDCTRVRYHSINPMVPLEICSACYFEGRFSSVLYNGDFVKLTGPSTPTAAAAAAEPAWTEQETLLLLEGIEMHDNNWVKIAEHVGTRSREACVLQFLQLPIEDPFLGAKTGDLGALQFGRYPVSASDNPVLSIAAFMATGRDPSVPAAAGTETATATATATGEPAATAAGQGLHHAGAVALAAMGAKAAAGKADTEREASRLVRELVHLQLYKMRIKLSHFAELEALVETEREQLAAERQQVYADRLLL
ncbi:hypothetical protein CXG81DRAFT_5970, partial [Caulochytrium protostelioides]